MKRLEQGNCTMAIWLGKQLLGQTDQLSFEMRGQPVLIVIPSAPPNALEGQEDEFERGVTVDFGHQLAPGSGRL